MPGATPRQLAASRLLRPRTSSGRNVMMISLLFLIKIMIMIMIMMRRRIVMMRRMIVSAMMMRSGSFPDPATILMGEAIT